MANKRRAISQGDDFSLAQMPEVFLFLADVRNRMVHIGKRGAEKIVILCGAPHKIINVE